MSFRPDSSTLPRDPRSQLGFSLIEIGVVLLILTVLLSGIAIPLATQVEVRRLEETRKLLEENRLAVMGFVAVNGRFPCPATATSNGLESFCTNASGGCGAETTALQTHGRCFLFASATNAPAYLPARTLGLSPLDSDGYMRDAWASSVQNRIRYAVYDLTFTHTTTSVTYSHVLTASDDVNDMKRATMANILRTPSATSERDLLSVCATATGATSSSRCASGSALANTPAVIYSLGPNASTTNGTSTHEAENVGGISSIFISRERSSGTDEFDDIVTWMSIYQVFNRMVEVGKMP